MHIGVIGINHKSADLSLREMLAKAYRCCFGDDSNEHVEHPFVLLSTCNRTELYFSSEDLTLSHSYFLGLLRPYVPLSFEHKLYSFFSYDCFTHLAMVTAGMDSAIIAETEIQGQVKNAYEKASQQRKLPSPLHYVFQKCLKIGKQVRTIFSLGRGMPTLPEIILQQCLKQHSHPEKNRILFVGASQVNDEVINTFEASSYENIDLCNRTLDRAQNYAKGRSIRVLPWEKLSKWHEYDIVILGTKSNQHLISDELPKRPLKPTLLFDLCVPRNVAPELGVHQCISLYNIDEIDEMLQQKRRLKGREIFIVEKFILENVEKLMTIFSQRQHKQPKRRGNAISPMILT